VQQIRLWSEINLVLERMQAIEMDSDCIMTLQLHNLAVVSDL
jgi:hypothetical protein